MRDRTGAFRQQVTSTLVSQPTLKHDSVLFCFASFDTEGSESGHGESQDYQGTGEKFAVLCSKA